jgi:hypothetical protein
MMNEVLHPIKDRVRCKVIQHAPELVDDKYGVTQTVNRYATLYEFEFRDVNAFNKFYEGFYRFFRHWDEEYVDKILNEE